MIESYSLYREVLLSNKIKYGSKILNILDSNNVNDYIIENVDLITRLNLKIINSTFQDYKDVFEESSMKFGIIIMENIFDNPANITILNNIKELTNDNILFMFINKLTYDSTTLSFKLFKNVKDYTGFDSGIVYITDVFDILKDHEIKVIDNYRLHSPKTYLYSEDIYLLTCIKK